MQDMDAFYGQMAASETGRMWKIQKRIDILCEKEFAYQKQ
jgi:hypothetical protein